MIENVPNLGLENKYFCFRRMNGLGTIIFDTFQRMKRLNRDTGGFIGDE